MSDTESINPVNRIKSKNETGHFTRVGDGITLLFDAEFNPITEMNLFTLSRRDSRKLFNTSSSYADDLANWEMYCFYNRIERLQATVADLEYYHSLLEGGISAQTRQPFAQSTISRRVGTVKSFYRFCVDQHLLVDDGNSPHRYQGNIRGQKKGKTTRFIDLVSLGQILDALGPAVTHSRVTPSRDRTVAEFLFCIGGRLEDAANLKLSDVLNWKQEFDADPEKFLLEHTLTGKNGVSRTVLILRPLVNVLMQYIETTRAEVIEHALRAKRGWRAPSQVFLNSVNSNHRDVGEAASRDTLGRAFVGGVKKANLFYYEDRVVFDEGGEPIVSNGQYKTELVLRVKHTIHHLRHTFAAVLSNALKNNGNNAPFKIVQSLLGHAWLSTTVDTYANHLALDEPEITDAYLAVLRGLDFHGVDE